MDNLKLIHKTLFITVLHKEIVLHALLETLTGAAPETVEGKDLLDVEALITLDKGLAS